MGNDRTSTAPAASSVSRCAIGFVEYRLEMTSPCSVILIRPCTVLRGNARIALFVGPPPRPTAPPRPWKNMYGTPRLSSSAESSSCALYRPQLDARSEEHTSELQ